MVSTADLPKFTGSMLIIPVGETLKKKDWQALETLKGQNTFPVFITQLTQSNSDFPPLLRTFGFRVKDDLIKVKDTLTLEGIEALGSTTLPRRSYILNVSSPAENSLATWGKTQPAIVITKQAALINWPASSPLPQKLLESITPQTPAVETAPPVPSIEITVTPIPETPNVVESKESVTPPDPSTTETVTKPAETLIPSDRESYPENLYEFDDKGKSIQIKDSQDELADFYNIRMRDLRNLDDKVGHLSTALSNNPTRLAALKEQWDEVLALKSTFESQWLKHQYQQALKSYQLCKAKYTAILLNEVPAMTTEARAIWLDRGSIVAAQTPENLKTILKNIHQAGFNVIYFETLNAGYAVYPSQVTLQNPQIKGWDPLQVATEEAHRLGMELHAWVWCFAAGNTRHNRIIGQALSYPGPILSRPDMNTESLKNKTGVLVLPEQHEFWLSPASYKARAFLIELYTEIITKYDVDGLQLDYIRYPFQKPGNLMGYEAKSVQRFESETGLKLSEPNEYTYQAWAAWKAFQVTSFVREVHDKLKRIKPSLTLSAAVFPLPRQNRMTMIQQDWETWLQNGWIDTLSPMAYSRSSRSLQHLVNYIHDMSGNKTLVYPGLSLAKLNSLDLLDTLEVCQNTGVMGTTMFAYQQLNPNIRDLLDFWHTDNTAPLVPHRNPLQASLELVQESQKFVTNIKPNVIDTGLSSNLSEIENTLNKLEDSIQNPLEQSKKPLVVTSQDWARTLVSTITTQQQATQDELSLYQMNVLKDMALKIERLLDFAGFQQKQTQRYQNTGVFNPAQ